MFVFLQSKEFRKYQPLAKFFPEVINDDAKRECEWWLLQSVVIKSIPFIQLRELNILWGQIYSRLQTNSLPNINITADEKGNGMFTHLQRIKFIGPTNWVFYCFISSTLWLLTTYDILFVVKTHMRNFTYRKNGAKIMDIKVGRKTFHTPADESSNEYKKLTKRTTDYAKGIWKIFPGLKPSCHEASKRDKMCLRNVMTSTLGNVPTKKKYKAQGNNDNTAIPYDTYGAGCRIDVMYL